MDQRPAHSPGLPFHPAFVISARVQYASTVTASTAIPVDTYYCD